MLRALSAKEKMCIFIIYTQNSMLISKKQYQSWREVQDEFNDYTSSLGPWGIQETVDYLNEEYPDLTPSASKQVDSLLSEAPEYRVLSFE